MKRISGDNDDELMEIAKTLAVILGGIVGFFVVLCLVMIMLNWTIEIIA